MEIVDFKKKITRQHEDLTDDLFEEVKAIKSAADPVSYLENERKK